MPFDDSDQTLVGRVKEGDVRAFETLHRRYYQRVYRFVYAKVGNPEDASDLACEVFCRALKSLPSYQFRRTGSLYPWLQTIAGNLVIDRVRDRPAGGMLSLDAQSSEEVDSFLDYLPDDGPSAQDLVERAEVQGVVREAIDQLPPDQARAVALRFLGDLSIREIAVALDRSEGAIKSLLHRALLGLRKHLKDTCVRARSENVTGSKFRSERAESHGSTEVLKLHRGD